MGEMLIEAVLKDEFRPSWFPRRLPGTPAIGKDAGELVGMPCGVMVTSDVEAGLRKPIV